jgi:hypothetical protein
MDMQARVDDAVQAVVDVVKQWDPVDTIAKVESGEDIYDPYFFVSLDVYYEGELPELAERKRQFATAFAFESLEPSRKDRFLLDEIPFRLEYKQKSRFDEILETADGTDGVLRDSGTYVFYRMKEGEVVYAKSDWLERARQRLEDLPDAFWTHLRNTVQARMEHYLSDLSAAVMRSDQLFYLVSSAGFARSLCGVLFAINQEFEPSGRLMAERVRSLPVLPDSFHGRFESFLRHEADLRPDRKREIAELLAKSVIAL